MKHPSALGFVAAAALAVASLAGTGCASSPPQAVVRARAASDLSCPGGRLDVQGLGGASFAAVGCGLRAVYSCDGGGEGDPFGASCTRVTGVTAMQAP